MSDEIIDLMISSGFENVRAFALSDTLAIEYENRIYSRERDAISVIIAMIMDATDNIQKLVLVPKKDDVRLLQITISRDDYLASAGNPDIFDKLETSRKVIITDYALAGRKHNPSVGKVDIILHPAFDSLLGHYDDPLIYRFAISPEFSIFLGKGVRSSTQVRFLLHDEVEYEKRRIALTRLCLDYTYSPPASTSMSLDVGYFGDNRYGLATEVLRFGWDNRLGVGSTAAWLGNVYYRDSILYYTKMWNWIALVNLQYRLPFWNVLLTTRFGKFLYQDHGVSAEITRFFRNSCITIFAAKTDHGSIGGFELQLLTYPRRHPAPHRVRVRLPTLLKMNYRYTENDVGFIFPPGHNADYIVDNLWLMDL